MHTQQTTPLEELRKAFALGLDLLGHDDVKLGFTSLPTSSYRTCFRIENGDSTFILQRNDFVLFSIGDCLGDPIPIKSKTVFHPPPFLKRGTAVLFSLSQPSFWTTVYHLEKFLEKIASNAFIRVIKRSFINGTQFGDPQVVGIFFQQNFVHDSQNKFDDYESGLSEKFAFKFSFERRDPYESTWVEIEDPRK